MKFNPFHYLVIITIAISNLAAKPSSRISVMGQGMDSNKVTELLGIKPTTAMNDFVSPKNSKNDGAFISLWMHECPAEDEASKQIEYWIKLVTKYSKEFKSIPTVKTMFTPPEINIYFNASALHLTPEQMALFVDHNIGISISSELTPPSTAHP